jgi:hypothetical protein
VNWVKLAGGVFDVWGMQTSAGVLICSNGAMVFVPGVEISDAGVDIVKSPTKPDKKED